MADTLTILGPIDLARLAAPFPPSAISWRVGATNSDKTKGLALAYIDARDVMRRLDEVVGPPNWQDEFVETAKGRVICRIGIRCAEGWVWKSDGAGDSDVEAEKGAISDALKRAGVHWGIGRYLYDMPATWVQIEQRGKTSIIKDSEHAKLARVAAQTIPGAVPQSAIAPGSASEADPQPPESRSRVNPNSSNQLKKNGAWDSFTDRIRGFVEADDVEGLKAWYASDEVQARVAAWPENWRDQAEETFEQAHDGIVKAGRA